MATPTLFHFTCDHGRAAMGDQPVLRPGADLVDGAVPWTSALVWLTDLERPNRDGLGLTSHAIRCDRTQHRYRVLDGERVLRWTDFARDLPREYRESIEGTPGAMPAHWWVAISGVRAVYDPLEVPAVSS